MQTLEINEIYKSIQGETSFSGLPFSFIRLKGCGLRCSYCDSKYAYNSGRTIEISSILEQILSHKTRYVLITGGEPLDQKNCLLLTKNLLKKNYVVLIETGGTHSIFGFPKKTHFIIDIKTPSSKMSHRTFPGIFEQISQNHEIKFVIQNRKDYDFSRELIEKHRLQKRSSVLMSCVFGKLDYKNLVKWILDDNLEVRFQLQIHKHIWSPGEKGV